MSHLRSLQFFVAKPVLASDPILLCPLNGEKLGKDPLYTSAGQFHQGRHGPGSRGHRAREVKKMMKLGAKNSSQSLFSTEVPSLRVASVQFGNVVSSPWEINRISK